MFVWYTLRILPSMRNLLILVIGLTLFSCKTISTSSLGRQAHALTQEMVNFGPRPPGSPEIEKVREWIRVKAEKENLTMQKRPFVARTPLGLKNMVNLSVMIPGTKHDDHVILLAHYDSKYMPKINFVGANDAASSVALLLTLIKPIAQLQLPFDVQLVFVDGEEAFVEWNYNDSLYGSRQMAQDVRGAKIKGLIVVDMVGDKDLSFIRSRGSDAQLISKMEESLKEMNQSSRMESHWSYIMDDHTPFVEMGVPTLHLMDFTFGGKQSPGTHWHTEKDDMESISAESLAITGELILRILKKI